MGLDALQARVQIRKSLCVSVGAFYRLVCNHPLLVGVVLYVIFLHGSFPAVLYRLVSSSPTIVCTALLLGTLLSFGHPNIPEIEVEDKTCAAERIIEKRRDVAENASEETSCAKTEIGLADGDDASPMLHELHPLTDAALQHCDESNDGSDDEPDKDTEDHEEDGDDCSDDGDDGDDDDYGRVAQVDKGDSVKSAITWTEHDEKNLMDLGTSDQERNQRLENLMARRRARKNMRMSAEKNLKDLESSDYSNPIAPISTLRQIPFDLFNDSYDEMGFLSTPRSAPPTLLPRRNPFDLPYEKNEEKPDLRGDNFGQEFMPPHHKGRLFRRHESFHLRPSPLGAPRHERRDRNLRAYFVPERISPDERQSSEMSDSKLGAFSETESVGSTVEKSFSEGELLQPGAETPTGMQSSNDHEKLHDVDISISTNIPKALHPCSSSTLCDTFIPFESQGSRGNLIDLVDTGGVDSLNSKGPMTEEAGKIKDVNEVSLLELDTLRDLGVKKTSNVNEIEGHSESEKTNGDEIQELGVIGLLNAEVMPQHTEGEHSEFELSHKDSNMAKGNLEIPILEAGRSMEDIDLDFKRAHEGIEVEKSVIVSSNDNKRTERVQRFV